MSKSPQYWMVKQEPTSYAWSAFVKDGRAAWTGVRNYAARLNLRAMKKGDLVFYYHSVVGKEVVGLAEVAREAYPDPTAEEGDWSCVDLVPVKALPNPLSLAPIKDRVATRRRLRAVADVESPLIFSSGGHSLRCGLPSAGFGTWSLGKG